MNQCRKCQMPLKWAVKQYQSCICLEYANQNLRQIPRRIYIDCASSKLTIAVKCIALQPTNLSLSFPGRGKQTALYILKLLWWREQVLPQGNHSWLWLNLNLMLFFFFFSLSPHLCFLATLYLLFHDCPPSQQRQKAGRCHKHAC